MAAKLFPAIKKLASVTRCRNIAAIDHVVIGSKKQPAHGAESLSSQRFTAALAKKATKASERGSDRFQSLGPSLLALRRCGAAEAAGAEGGGRLRRRSDPATSSGVA